jgi:hypothetical protein
VANRSEVVQKSDTPISGQPKMLFGNMPRDGGHLFLDMDEANELREDPTACAYVKRFVGSEELINGTQRYCLWIENSDVDKATTNSFISQRVQLVAANRRASQAESTRDFAAKPYRFVQIAGQAQHQLII